MSDYSDRYVARLIKQYWEKTNAPAEISMQSATWEKVYDLLLAIPVEFDVDGAYGEQLNIIGRIVGITRNVDAILAKVRFGFDGDADSRGMADYYDSSVTSAVFADIYESPYSDYTLDDQDFRLFITAKILYNIVSAYMVSDDYTSINDVIIEAFEGEAYMVDNQDMTMTLYVTDDIDTDRLALVSSLGLIPTPQGVSYTTVTIV